MLKAGDHVPVIPFVEVLGNGLTEIPVQSGEIAAKFGIVRGIIEIVNVVDVAH